MKVTTRPGATATLPQHEGGGNAGDIMLVRAWYQHTLLTPFLAQGLSKLNDGKAYLTATTAFRNEPW